MSQFLVGHFLNIGWYLRLGCQLFTVKLCLYSVVKGWGPEGYNLAMVSAEEESGSAGNVVVVVISNHYSSLLPYLENKMK